MDIMGYFAPGLFPAGGQPVWPKDASL